MTNIILLFACLAAGIMLRRSAPDSEHAHLGLDAFVIHLSLPCLILSQVHAVVVTPELACSVLMPWLLFMASTGFFWIAAKVFQIPPTTTGALILSAGLANTSIMGLPMITAFYGPQNLSIGILIGQLGTYLVLSTLGIIVACLYSGTIASRAAIVRRVATFPPLLALILALMLWNFNYPAWLGDLLRRMGDTLAPVALFSVGLQLRFKQTSGQQWATLGLGLGFKLVLGPLAILMIYLGLFHRDTDITRVTIFEAAMGPQIGSAIVGIQYGLDPNLMTQMVGIGTVLSFLTIPLWWAGLRFT